ncbi:hypothetical protein C0Q58_17075 [Streptomyces albidoflavus]|nr:hypothetical protein C0Q58_17075 [Streptomyces albidoflavus]
MPTDPTTGPATRPPELPRRADHQPDPSGQEKNPYLHAEGDPVNRIDPIGPLPMGDVVGAAAGTVTGIALDGVGVAASKASKAE